MLNLVSRSSGSGVPGRQQVAAKILCTLLLKTTDGQLVVAPFGPKSSCRKLFREDFIMGPPKNDFNSQGMYKVSICESHQREDQGVRPGQGGCLTRSRNSSGGRVLLCEPAWSLV